MVTSNEALKLVDEPHDVLSELKVATVNPGVENSPHNWDGERVRCYCCGIYDHLVHQWLVQRTP